MSALFDTILIVDWSARSTPSPPKPSPDAIWIGACVRGESEEPVYLRTRAQAVDRLADRLAAERSAGRRVLVGFDFPFGYPRGFAAAVTGRDAALGLWVHLKEIVRDGADNANDRFAAAARLNAQFPGEGPFWGRPETLPLDGLSPYFKGGRGHGLPERRIVEERVPGTKTCWQLNGAGSVGGQVLTGLPALERLRRDARIADDVAVWPFETGLRVPEAGIVLAEIYPSLLRGAIRAAMTKGAISDAVQVRVTAAAYAALDRQGALAPLFEASGDLGAEEAGIVAREEGWILGVGHEVALRAVIAPPLRSEPVGAALSPPLLRNDCFALPQGVDWVPVDVALDRLRDALAPVAGMETVALERAGGRILAKPARALRPHPPYANAAVDGYGFAQASLGPGPHALPLVAGRAAAGVPLGADVPAGSAARVLTGAMLPGGVDTLVLQEDVRLADVVVQFDRGLKRGANTRAMGEDVAAGVEILGMGHLLMPQDLALAASVGLATLVVRRPLRVGVLSTGDEIRPAGAAVEAHQLHDANRPMLLEMIRRWDMAPVDLGHASDSVDAVAAALDRGAAGADAILTTGGASAGDEDHVSRILAERGRLDIWRIAVKPGRPLALGVWAGCPVFGLPGNPVAAFVCALIFARPALGLLAGAPWSVPRGLMLPAAFEKSKKPGRREYLRARPRMDGSIEIFASEGSGRVSGLAWARGLVELEDEPRVVRPGDPVRYLAFADFGL